MTFSLNTNILTQNSTVNDQALNRRKKSNWIRSSFFKPCQVCGDKTGKCSYTRPNPTTGDHLFLCNTHKQPIKNKYYKWAKVASNNKAGVFYFDRQREYWRKMRKLHADKLIKVPYVDVPYPSDNTIFGIRSPMDTGKTRWLSKLSKHYQSQGIVVIALGYRNSLLLQTAHQAGLYHIHEHGGKELIDRGDETLSVALCFDSILKIPLEHFDNAVIVLDECMATVPHALFSNTIERGKREASLNHFEEAIMRCKAVICLDGSLSDWCIDYLKELDPSKKVETVENTFKAPRAPVQFYNGAIDTHDKKLRSNNFDQLKTWMVDFATLNPILVGVDSQTTAESIEKMLNDAGITGGWRIDSKTTCEAATKKILTNIDSKSGQSANLCGSPIG